MTVPAGYDDVVLAVPVTVPYVRYSIKSAHWFLGGALAALLEGAKIPKARIDGLRWRASRSCPTQPSA